MRQMLPYWSRLTVKADDRSYSWAVGVPGRVLASGTAKGLREADIAKTAIVERLLGALKQHGRSPDS